MVLFKGFSSLNPLHQAIIQGDSKEVSRLREQKNYLLERDKNGFTPLDLSQLLGQYSCEKILGLHSIPRIKVQIKNSQNFNFMNSQEFKKKFDVTYRSHLTFSSYSLLQQAVKRCPYLLRLERLISLNDTKEILYQQSLKNKVEAQCYIKWIDPIMGYGLFADEDIEKDSYIGEYVGAMRQLDSDQPTTNPYCFYYPTKLFSRMHLVIDAEKQGNSFRFVNHSEAPNLQPIWLVNRNLLHLVFIAKESILKDTQLTFNYGSNFLSNSSLT